MIKGDKVIYVSQINGMKEHSAEIEGVNEDGSVDVVVGLSHKRRVPVWAGGELPFVTIRGQRIPASFVKAP